MSHEEFTKNFTSCIKSTFSEHWQVEYQYRQEKKLEDLKKEEEKENFWKKIISPLINIAGPTVCAFASVYATNFILYKLLELEKENPAVLQIAGGLFFMSFQTGIYTLSEANIQQYKSRKKIRKNMMKQILEKMKNYK